MSNQSPHHHLYNTKVWRDLRAAQLRNEPLCRDHADRGRVVEARVVDHVVPHKGDEELFFDPTNLQSLCKPCHDGHKQRLERGGVVTGCGADGIPLDPAHHWRQ